MRKYFLIIGFIFCLSTGLVLAQENTEAQEPKQSESTSEQTEKDCKKVCVKRDGYGMCTKFEERCEK